MHVCRSGQIVYFDIDDTLLEWKSCEEHDPGAVKVENNGHIFYKKQIKGNLDSLKEHAHAGHVVVVWSQGGSDWAASVVKALGIEKYVDVILTKPDWYYDDKDAEHWLPERQFIA